MIILDYKILLLLSKEKKK